MGNRFQSIYYFAGQPAAGRCYPYRTIKAKNIMIPVCRRLFCDFINYKSIVYGSKYVLITKHNNTAYTTARYLIKRTKFRQFNFKRNYASRFCIHEIHCAAFSTCKNTISGKRGHFRKCFIVSNACYLFQVITLIGILVTYNPKINSLRLLRFRSVCPALFLYVGITYSPAGAYKGVEDVLISGILFEET